MKKHTASWMDEPDRWCNPNWCWPVVVVVAVDYCVTTGCCTSNWVDESRRSCLDEGFLECWNPSASDDCRWRVATRNRTWNHHLEIVAWSALKSRPPSSCSKGGNNKTTLARLQQSRRQEVFSMVLRRNKRVETVPNGWHWLNADWTWPTDWWNSSDRLDCSYRILPNRLGWRYWDR